jgi:hypothetical protein
MLNGFFVKWTPERIVNKPDLTGFSQGSSILCATIKIPSGIFQNFSSSYIWSLGLCPGFAIH